MQDDIVEQLVDSDLLSDVHEDQYKKIQKLKEIIRIQHITLKGVVPELDFKSKSVVALALSSIDRIVKDILELED